MMLALILFLSALSGIQGDTEGGKIVACNFWEESSPKAAPSRFTMDDLRKSNCTHILYSSDQGVDAIGMICSGDTAVNYTGSVPDLGSKKIGHPNLKVYLYINLVFWCLRKAGETTNFTSNIVTYLQANGFDGLADTATSDDENWQKRVEFHQELRREREDRQLSLMVLTETREDFNVSQIENDAFIAPNHCNTLDYLSSLKDRGSKAITEEKCIQNVLDLGAEPSKILVPLVFSGARLSSETEIRDPLSNMELKIEDYTPYNKFCMHLQDASWKSSYDEQTKTSLLTKDKEAIVFESPRKIIEKINYIKQKQLGGLLVMFPDFDDFEGKCGQEKSPYLSTIGKELS